MSLETVQTVAGWLSAAGTGVNALLPSVPRYAGDAVPPPVTVVQAFRNGDAARGQAPQTGLPVLEVGLFQDPSQETAPSVRPYPAGADVQVHVRYIAAKSTDTALVLRQTALTLRAASKAIGAAAIGGTTVNELQIITVGDIRTLAMFVADGDTVVTGALVATVRVRDLWTHAP